MTRQLASPVIIRPKHGAFKGVPLVAVHTPMGLRCDLCVLKEEDCVKVDGLNGCGDYYYHYEHAEVKHDKG